jgi:hypothetical protein
MTKVIGVVEREGFGFHLAVSIAIQPKGVPIEK